VNVVQFHNLEPRVEQVPGDLPRQRLSSSLLEKGNLNLESNAFIED